MRRRPLLAAFCALAYAFLLGPILLMVAVAFTAGDTIRFPPQGLSLRWFATALGQDSFRSGLTTSVLVALGATLLALLVGVPITLAVRRGRLPGGGLVAALSLSPVVVPEIVLGLALFQQLMVGLRVTAAGALLIGHSVLLIPYAVRVTGASLAMADPMLEEASRGLGAGPVRTFFEVTLPVMAPGIGAAGMLSLITSFNNVPLSLLLTGPGTGTLPVALLHYVQFSFDPAVAAVSAMLLAATVVVAVLTERLIGFNKVFTQ